jgi:hypothetical protein
LNKSGTFEKRAGALAEIGEDRVDLQMREERHHVCRGKFTSFKETHDRIRKARQILLSKSLSKI